jgi:hypothetical protein
VKKGDRIADVDPRGRTDDLDHISDKAHRVAEGVHEALLGLVTELAQRRRAPAKQRRRSGGARAAAGSPKNAGSGTSRRTGSGESVGAARLKPAPPPKKSKETAKS